MLIIYADTMKQSDVDPLPLFLLGFLPRPQLADVDLANVAWSFVTATFEEDPIARNPTK